MPELPEIETICRDISPYLVNKQIKNIIIRNRNLRWPITNNLEKNLKNQTINKITRRGKYILFNCTNGTLIIHLGMSGKLTILHKNINFQKHDHLELRLSNKIILRYHDPRRFGSIHWTVENPAKFKLLKNLGVEPLTHENLDLYLFNNSKKRCCTIKSLLMNAKIIVGIGNIYANEILFQANILPTRQANKINLLEYKKITKAIKLILDKAIINRGTTLRDFVDGKGKQGNFQKQLYVYGRNGMPCKKCATILKELYLNQRVTIFCPICQK